MMLYPAMKDLLEKIPSRYELVNVVAHRAREIAAEAEASGEPLEEKPVTLAVQMFASGEEKLADQDITMEKREDE